MCIELDPDPYLKGQGHTTHLKVRVRMLVSTLKLTYALMDYHLTRYKCFLIERMCSDLDPNAYHKGQGQTRHLRVRVHMLL